jgi:hypothetical protein
MVMCGGGGFLGVGVGRAGVVVVAVLAVAPPFIFCCYDFKKISRNQNVNWNFRYVDDWWYPQELLIEAQINAFLPTKTFNCHSSLVTTHYCECSEETHTTT